MDSKPLVSLSTTQQAAAAAQTYPHDIASALSSSSSSGSFLIRAPPTIDDDDDSDFESNGSEVIVSDSGDSRRSISSSSGSENFVSGEEFETASERPFAIDPDEQILEESVFSNRYQFSRPFVADPDEEFSQNSQNSIVHDENDGLIDDLAALSNADLKPAVIIPVAQVSMDDDFYELSSGDEGGIVDDGGFSSLVKVPSVRNIERVDSMPRVKVMEIDSGEDESFSPGSSVSGEFVGVENGSLSNSGEAVMVKNSVNGFVSSELIGDKGNGETLEGRVDESFERDKEDAFEVVKSSVEQKSAVENFEKERIDSVSEHEMKELSDRMGSVSGHAFVPENLENKTEPEVESRVHLNDSLAAEKLESKTEPEIESGVHLNDPVTAENLESKTEPEIESGVHLTDLLAAENLESKTEPEIESGVHWNDPLATTSVESLDGAIMEKEIQTGGSEFSELNPTMQDGDFAATTESDRLENAESSSSGSLNFVKPSSISDYLVKPEAEDVIERIGGRQQGVLSREDVEELIFGTSEASKQIMKGLEERFASSSLAVGEGCQDHLQRVDGEIVMDSDDEQDPDTDGERNELFDSAALAALLKAATSAESNGGALSLTSDNGSRVFSLERPNGSGSLVPSRPSPAANVDQDVFKDDLSEEEKKKIEKIQLLRVKFLRLVHRLGHSPDDSIVSRVLYRLALGFGRHSSQAFSLESVKRVAMQHEAEGKDDLDFSLNILVLGKTGVGKSATINSIFSEEKATIDAFKPATTSVKVIAGTIDGVKIRFLDTPGLRSSVMEQTVNKRILASIKKFMKKYPPDVVLYVDRLDTYTRDYTDLSLLRSVTSSLGALIWQNAIVSLTHAACSPSEESSWSPRSYELFVAQRSHVIQQGISQAVGDMRLMNPSMMHPVSLVENHPSCQKNKIGESMLPNGQSWRPQLLLLCYSLKILSEANSVSKTRDVFNLKKLFGFRLRSAPLSHMLSSLLQSRDHPKLSAYQGGGEVDSDIDLGGSSDSEQEEDDEYDQLPPFKPLRKSQVDKLSKEQRKAYFEEYDYRVKLFQKKQWNEELKRLREIKKKGNNRNAHDYNMEDGELEDESQGTVPVNIPDHDLPRSFDGDNPDYRYRKSVLDTQSQLFVRPVLESNGWDHDYGYDSVILERSLVIARRFPGALAVHIKKDKKEFSIYLDSSVSAKHGENGSTMAGIDIQRAGRQFAYTFRGETKIKNFKINKTTAGLSITVLDENVAYGLKLEDQVAIGKRLVLTGNAGLMRSQGDAAYGGNLELRLKDEDFPIEQNNSSLGLSLVNWRGDLSLMGNIQSQFSIGRGSKMLVRGGLSKQGSGQITVKINSSDQLHLAVGMLTVVATIIKDICSGGKKFA